MVFPIGGGIGGGNGRGNGSGKNFEFPGTGPPF